MATSPRDYFSGWTPQPFTRRNMIINGDLQVWQRGDSGVGSGYVSADRWMARANTTLAKYPLVDGGAHNAMSLTRTITPSDTLLVLYGVELLGQNIKAGNVYTFSADVFSDRPCDIVLRARFRDTVGSSTNEVIALTETVIEEDLPDSEWRRVEGTFTIENDAASTNKALELRFGGQLEVGAEWTVDTDRLLITNVKLELGPKATPFEPRSYGEELALCQRYYWASPSSILWAAQNNGSSQYIVIPWPVEMRVSPTMEWSDFTDINGSGLTVTAITKSAYGVRSISMSGVDSIGNRYTFVLYADAEL